MVTTSSKKRSAVEATLRRVCFALSSNRSTVSRGLDLACAAAAQISRMAEEEEEEEKREDDVDGRGGHDNTKGKLLSRYEFRGAVDWTSVGVEHEEVGALMQWLNPDPRGLLSVSRLWDMLASFLRSNTLPSSSPSSLSLSLSPSRRAPRVTAGTAPSTSLRLPSGQRGRSQEALPVDPVEKLLNLLGDLPCAGQRSREREDEGSRESERDWGRGGKSWSNLEEAVRGGAPPPRSLSSNSPTPSFSFSFSPEAPPSQARSPPLSDSRRPAVPAQRGRPDHSYLTPDQRSAFSSSSSSMLALHSTPAEVTRLSHQYHSQGYPPHYAPNHKHPTNTACSEDKPRLEMSEAYADKHAPRMSAHNHAEKHIELHSGSHGKNQWQVSRPSYVPHRGNRGEGHQDSFYSRQVDPHVSFWEPGQGTLGGVFQAESGEQMGCNSAGASHGDREKARMRDFQLLQGDLEAARAELAAESAARQLAEENHVKDKEVMAALRKDVASLQSLLVDTEASAVREMEAGRKREVEVEGRERRLLSCLLRTLRVTQTQHPALNHYSHQLDKVYSSLDHLVTNLKDEHRDPSHEVDSYENRPENSETSNMLRKPLANNGQLSSIDVPSFIANQYTENGNSYSNSNQENESISFDGYDSLVNDLSDLRYEIQGLLG